MTKTPSGGGLTPPGPSLEPSGPPVTADPTMPVGELGLGVSHDYPTRSGWSEPRTRVISCVAFDPDGKLDEPVRDLLRGRESAG